MSTTHFASRFRKKYASMPDGDGKKKKRFFPTFKKKKSKPIIVPEVQVEEPANNEDNLTVALSHLSSNPSSPTRSNDSMMEDPKLWTSFDEEEVQTNASSDMLLIFTSASNDEAEDTTPLQMLMDQPLSLTSFTDNGEDIIFRKSLPPARKTTMPTSLVPMAPISERQLSKPVTPAPAPAPAPKKVQKVSKPSAPPQQSQTLRKSTAIDMDTNDQWYDYDDESHWVEFVDERRGHADWEWNQPNNDWGTAPMDEAAEVAWLTSENFEYLPRDTSDEASLDPSTVPATVSVTPFSNKRSKRRTITSPMTIVHETPSGEVEVCDPECPLRFFKEHQQEEDVEQEPPADTPGYPFLADAEDEETKETEVEDMFSFSFYQHQISKFQSVESRQHMTKRLHRETLSIIGSVSEKLYTLENTLQAYNEETRSRFQSRQNHKTPESKQDDNEGENADAVSIATSNSTETRKKRNTSYFSAENFRYPSEMFGHCNVIEPFFRFGQAEV